MSNGLGLLQKIKMLDLQKFELTVIDFYKILRKKL